MTHKVTLPESICKKVNTLGILTDHIATRKLAKIESSDWCLHDPKEHKKERNLRGN